MYTDFIDASNRKAKEQKRWCLTHPTGYLGKDHFGNWYTRCTYGNKTNQDCVVGKDEEGGE